MNTSERPVLTIESLKQQLNFAIGTLNKNKLGDDLIKSMDILLGNADKYTDVTEYERDVYALLEKADNLLSSLET